jgi:hypothetical protein
MVEKRGGKYHVVHGHKRKKGSKTDKPKGTTITSFDDPQEAYAMHYAIQKGQERRKKGNPHNPEEKVHSSYLNVGKKKQKKGLY